MIVIIDNYDSFVYNIARYFTELGQEVEVVRHDALDPVSDPRLAHARGLVISPGPGRPQQAGVSSRLVQNWSGRLPILGICLGHQVIGEVFGGRIVKARQPLHGEASPIHHQGEGIFQNITNPFKAGRYHSLIVELDERISPLSVTARSKEGEIMGLRHRTHPTFGVQFHPESILTEHGYLLLRNFLNYTQSGKDPHELDLDEW